jgi:hypothetical protein
MLFNTLVVTVYENTFTVRYSVTVEIDRFFKHLQKNAILIFFTCKFGSPVSFKIVLRVIECQIRAPLPLWEKPLIGQEARLLVVVGVSKLGLGAVGRQ